MDALIKTGSINTDAAYLDFDPLPARPSLTLSSSASMMRSDVSPRNRSAKSAAFATTGLSGMRVNVSDAIDSMNHTISSRSLYDIPPRIGTPTSSESIGFTRCSSVMCLWNERGIHTL